MPPSHDSGLFHEIVHGLSKIVEPFMRPINVVSKALSDRLEHWLSRKPKALRNHPFTTFILVPRMARRRSGDAIDVYGGLHAR